MARSTRPADVLADAFTAASALIGWRLVRTDGDGRRSGIIVETEAYPHDDPACHAFRGKTARNASMFREAGHAYVYRIHRSLCLNVVTGPRDRGEAVLIRAIEPEEGIDRMVRARARHRVGKAPLRGCALTNGPGKLCQALDVDLDLDGCWLFGPEHECGLRLEPTARDAPVDQSRRIGISRARTKRYRFFMRSNLWVSR